MEEATGAILQLLARGKQNVYLDGQDTSLFRTIHKRSTPFALEHREEFFPQGFKFGQVCRVDIPKRCDSMGEMLLQVTLPRLTTEDTQIRWSPHIVYTLIRRVQVYMAGLLVVDHERLWNYVSDALYTPKSRRYYARQVDRYINKEHQILIPLQMPWSTTRFFPMVATDVPIWMDVEVESLAACLVGGSVDTPTQQPPYAALLVQHVFMEKAERYTFLFKPLAFPVVWVADTETVFTSAAKQIKVDLSEINYPVKTLVWVVYRVGDSSFQFIKDAIADDALCLESQNLTNENPATLSSFAGRWRRRTESSRDDGIHVMHLGAPPEDTLISGALDFSKAKRPFLLLRLRQRALQEGVQYVCKVFAQCSRSIRIQYGQVGLF